MIRVSKCHITDHKLMRSPDADVLISGQGRGNTNYSKRIQYATDAKGNHKSPDLFEELTTIVDHRVFVSVIMEVK